MHFFFFWWANLTHKLHANSCEVLREATYKQFLDRSRMHTGIPKISRMHFFLLDVILENSFQVIWSGSLLNDFSGWFLSVYDSCTAYFFSTGIFAIYTISEIPQILSQKIEILRQVTQDINSAFEINSTNNSIVRCSSTD